MKLLGIETATELVGVAVGDAGSVAGSLWVTGRRRHTESLTPAISHLMGQVGIALSDLDALAVDVGPGLFTGLRVGLATAKGLAAGLGIGLIGLTSLEVLAWAAFESGWRGEVVAVVDARRSEVFAARYHADTSVGDPGMVEISPPSLFTPADLAAELAASVGPDPAAPRLVVGDGALRYRGVIEATPGIRVAGAFLAAPPPAALVALAAHRLSTGTTLVGPNEIEPMYLREADAKINWIQRHPPSHEAHP